MFDACDPAVREFAAGSFHLGEDLAHLDRVFGVDAPEATVFYCARILEAVSSHAAARAGGKPCANGFSSLCCLEELGLLSSARLAYFHSLRRLGNDSRHIHRPIQPRDAEVSMALLERLLRWYFVCFPYGPRLSDLWAGAQSGFVVREGLARVLRLLDEPSPDSRTLAALWRARPSDAFDQTPVVAALFAERLLSLGGPICTEALAGIEMALETFPTDLRLQQLRGWALRLVGRGDEAVAALELLHANFPEDEETLGILAGTYKRIWMHASARAGEGRRRSEMLRKASDLYRKAWRASRETHTYTGINAATLSLLSGAPERAQSIAQKIVDGYERRLGRLAPGNAMPFVDYWDRATFAEALLLLGRSGDSRREYIAAMDCYRDRETYIASTVDQINLILPHVGIAGDAGRFLHPETAVRGAGSADPSGSRGMDPPIQPREERPMYQPKPLDTSAVELSDDLRELTERIAEHVHDVWAQRRMADGWTYGPLRDDSARKHPDLVPYAELPESEKAYDRASAAETLKAIRAMGYRLER